MVGRPLEGRRAAQNPPQPPQVRNRGLSPISLDFLKNPTHSEAGNENPIHSEADNELGGFT